MPSSSFAPIRVAQPATSRDHLLAVADLLGIHPSGAVMTWLLGTPAAELRQLVRDGTVRPRCADHLVLLDELADGVRARLDDPDPTVRAARLAAWRTWLVRPSLPTASGLIRPLDRLAHPGGVVEALRDLRGVAEQRRGAVTLRLVSLARPAQEP